MLATEFLDRSRDPVAWRKHARALRRSADVTWAEFDRILIGSAANIRQGGYDEKFEEALEALDTAKLLYGLAFETALKAWLIQHFPSKVEIRVAMDGNGSATHAELRAIGVPTSNGHNLLALAEAAELFGERFKDVVREDGDKRALRNICRDLGEVVLWRGRYPVPLASSEPLRLDPHAPQLAVAHYMRDWLDPVLDALLSADKSEETSEVSRGDS